MISYAFHPTPKTGPEENDAIKIIFLESISLTALQYATGISSAFVIDKTIEALQYCAEKTLLIGLVLTPLLSAWWITHHPYTVDTDI